MSQTVAESDEDRRMSSSHGRDGQQAELQRREEAYIRSRGYREVISQETRIYFLLVTVFDLLLISATVAVGATWLFAPVYVGVALSYIAGALYLTYKLFTY